MLNIKKISGKTGVPIWQSKNIQVAQGGFTLDDSFKKGTVIPAGTPVGFDEGTRIAKIFKGGVLQASATGSATQYKVLKSTLLTAGAQVKYGSATAKTITEIDTTNPEYDLITLDTTLGVAVKTGEHIYVDDEGYRLVKGLLYETVTIGENGLVDVSVVLRGTVYERRIVPVPSKVKEKLPLIVFSQSF